MKTVDININNANSWQSLLNFVYPIGCIYITVNNVNPATIFGGTWQAIQGRFLLGAGDTYTAGNTGGAATVALTPAQTATKAHTHTMDHGHANNFSFSVGDHAAVSNRALSTGIAVSNHTATACTLSKNLAVSISNHGFTQPVFKYTAAKSHTHTLDGQMHFNTSGKWGYHKYTTIAAWTNQWGARTEGNESSSSSFSYGTSLGGSTNSATGGTANGTSGSLSTNWAIGSNHVASTNVIKNQASFSIPSASFTHSVGQPAFKTASLTHTPSVSGGVTAYGTSSAHQYTAGLTEANGSAHNNMPPYLAVYVWKRTA